MFEAIRQASSRVSEPRSCPPFAPYAKTGVRARKAKRDCMRIKKHEKSYIVELEDGSAWRIWPGDLAVTLHWMSSTWLEVSEIDDEHCTHALFDRTTRTLVRVVEATATFIPEQIEASLVG